MEEDLTDSSGCTRLSDVDIRTIQANLQTQLETFQKNISDANVLDTSNVCDDVKDKILNFEDDPALSKNQNNCRRITIASDLFMGICSIYECLVDHEFSGIVTTLVQWEKYECISRKISQRIREKMKMEKYFAKEAKSKLQKTLQESRNVEDARVSQTAQTEIGVPAVNEEDNYDKERRAVDIADEETPVGIINETLVPASDYSGTDDISEMFGHLTEIRAEPDVDSSSLQFERFQAPREINLPPSAAPDISVREPKLPEDSEDDVSRILQILENEIPENVVQEAEQPDALLETATGEAGDAGDAASPTKSPQVEEPPADRRESSMEWDLPDVEPVEKDKKKQRQLIIDKTTTIRNYSERALYLNNNIVIQRIQVFEGPPSILLSMSVNHLMRTQGFKSSLFRDVRSSKLNRLFERNLKIDKKPVEAVFARQARPEAEPKEIDITKVRTDGETVENVGMRIGMHSLPAQPVLAEITRERNVAETSVFQPPEISGGLQRETMVGTPISRLITSAIEPPDLERINAVPVSPVPRVQQLQGKSLDPETHSSWFQSTRENPPSAKYREFDYVYKKLEEYWSLCEIQGMEKSITLREFIYFEGDSSVANFLLVLRIVDKLSLQRKIVLIHKNRDVLLRPFEAPFVTPQHMLQKEIGPIL